MKLLSPELKSKTMARKKALSHEEQESLNRGKEPLKQMSFEESLGDIEAVHAAAIGLIPLSNPKFYYQPFRNQRNFNHLIEPREKNNGISNTIPDRTMSMREMMKRHASGIPIDAGHIPIYNGENDDLPDLATMDLADRQTVLENVEKEILEIKQRREDELKKKVEQKRKSDFDKVLKAKYEEWKQGNRASDSSSQPSPPSTTR